MKSRKEYSEQLARSEKQSWQLYFLSIFLLGAGLLGGAFALKNYDEKIYIKENYEQKIDSLNIVYQSKLEELTK